MHSLLQQQHRLVTAMLSMLLLCRTSSFTLAPFQTQSPTSHRAATTFAAPPPPTSTVILGAATMTGAATMASTPPTNFEERMRMLVTDATASTVVRQRSIATAASSSSSVSSSPLTSNSNNNSNNNNPAAAAAVVPPLSRVVRQVKTLKEYTAMLKEVVVNVDNVDVAPITVVRFYSTYCPACKRAAPAYQGMIRHLVLAAQQQQQQQQRGIHWIDVEVNSSNLDVQQALGLKTIPTGFIYHPQAGLVAEMSLNKRNLKNVQEKIQFHIDIKNNGYQPRVVDGAAALLP